MKTNTNPLVCVCMPAYNSAATICESLESVLSQTYTNIRVIIVDNASVDNTVEIARGYAEKDSRVQVVCNPVNVGAENNFSRCIELASGDYTAIYHADDLYDSRMVEAEVEFLEEHPEAGAVFTPALEIDGEGKVIGRKDIPSRLLRPEEPVFDFREIFGAVLEHANFMVFPTALVRTEIYKKEILVWRGDKYKTSADLDVWLRIAERHKLGFIYRQLLRYRISTNSFTYTYARLRLRRHDMFLVLEDYVEKNKAGLGPRELQDYQLLLFKDDVNRAINYIIKNEQTEALALLRGIFGPAVILHSFRTMGQLKYLAIGYVAFCAALLPLGERGRKFLSVIRHKG